MWNVGYGGPGAPLRFYCSFSPRNAFCLACWSIHNLITKKSLQITSYFFPPTICYVRASENWMHLTPMLKGKQNCKWVHQWHTHIHLKIHLTLNSQCAHSSILDILGHWLKKVNLFFYEILYPMLRYDMHQSISQVFDEITREQRYHTPCGLTQVYFWGMDLQKNLGQHPVWTKDTGIVVLPQVSA